MSRFLGAESQTIDFLKSREVGFTKEQVRKHFKTPMAFVRIVFDDLKSSGLISGPDRYGRYSATKENNQNG